MKLDCLLGEAWKEAPWASNRLTNSSLEIGNDHVKENFCHHSGQLVFFDSERLRDTQCC